MKIIEIKAHCSNHENIRNILQSKDAVSKGTDHQIDTYFKVENGRLKLREGNIENNLIHYFRSNQEGPKQSNVTLFKSEPDSSLKKILEDAIGVLAVVDKEREIYFIDNVKFHLDTVKGLGQFMEIEAIDTKGTLSKEVLTEQCEHYLQLFEIPSKDLLSTSYSDMIMELKS